MSIHKYTLEKLHVYFERHKNVDGENVSLSDIGTGDK